MASKRRLRRRFQLESCNGKLKHNSFSEAMEYNNGFKGRNKGLNPYLCCFCNKWHLGHNPHHNEFAQKLVVEHRNNNINTISQEINKFKTEQKNIEFCKSIKLLNRFLDRAKYYHYVLNIFLVLNKIIPYKKHTPHSTQDLKNVEQSELIITNAKREQDRLRNSKFDFKFSFEDVAKKTKAINKLQNIIDFETAKIKRIAVPVNPRVERYLELYHSICAYTNEGGLVRDHD